MPTYPASFATWPPAVPHRSASASECQYRYSSAGGYVAASTSLCPAALSYPGLGGYGSTHPDTELDYGAMLSPPAEFATPSTSPGPAPHSLYGGSQIPASSWLEQFPGPSYSLPAPMCILNPPGLLVTELDPAQLEQARTEIRNMDVAQLLNQDGDGDTMLHLYAAMGLRYHAYAVAEHYQELGQLDVKEHKGKTPLLVATAANQAEIVHDLLVLGADVNAADQKGQTALHLAATYGFPNVIQVIFASGLNTVNVEARNFEGLTPLHCAVISQNSTFRKQSVLCPVPELMQISNQENQYCIQLLLHLGAIYTSQDIKSNKTVLHFAVQEGNYALAKFFLELPNVDSRTFVNMKAHGNTALHMAAGLSGHPYQENIIRLLLSHGADPTIRNLENDQAVHLLPPGKAGEQIKPLLKRGRAMSSSQNPSVSL
ncbi:NF-kappa-B inhibitor delta [Rhinatrema bivittatum]|uniref:NF-kappa-B inhibitor delta n=1 Tax=Rhinatrema bivittatum TaxID=194408 RepID=UPI00112CA1C5|nr:NF-kappa-B inhibitor delta [Rhinatrema bivittatum]